MNVPNHEAGLGMEIEALDPTKTPSSRFIVNLSEEEIADAPLPIRRAIEEAVQSGASNLTLDQDTYRAWTELSDRITSERGS